MEQDRIVKALMEELCAEKDIDYDAFIMVDMHRKNMTGLSLIGNML